MAKFIELGAFSSAMSSLWTKISNLVANKVDKVEGKGLSSNDYTTEEKTKLAGLTQVTVDAEITADSTNPVQSKAIDTALTGLAKQYNDAAAKLKNVDATVAQHTIDIKSAQSTADTAKQTAEGLDGRVTTVQEAVTTLTENKQEKLTAGNGIAIAADNTISVTIDHTLYKVDTELPEAPAAGDENKIHLVPATNKGDKNNYKEYIWKGDAWEELGEIAAATDLSDYLKSEDATKTYLTKTDATSTYAAKTDVPTAATEDEVLAVINGLK